MQTERFGGVLLIDIQRYRVSLEETDGLQIRLNLQELLSRGLLVVNANNQIVRADPTKALTLPVSALTATNASDANATLNLFTTCPDFPTSEARTGVLSLTKVTLAQAPNDTGENERIAGALTATLSRAYTSTSVGTLESLFDFAPPRRPLTVFQ
jgi:hypothetical protein